MISLSLLATLCIIHICSADNICSNIETYNIKLNKTIVHTIFVPKCSFVGTILKLFGKKCNYDIQKTLEYVDETVPKTRTVYKCCDGWRDLEVSNCTKPVCDPECVHGECVKPYECRCRDGWTGSICGDKCRGGTYGSACGQSCNCGNGSVTCHHVTGECQCASGFTGERCQENCQPGYFGFGCSERCACKHDSQCRVSDGFCDCSIHYLYPAEAWDPPTQTTNPLTQPSNFPSAFHATEADVFNSIQFSPIIPMTSIPPRSAIPLNRIPTVESFTYTLSGFFAGPSCSSPCNPNFNCTLPCDCDTAHGDCNPFTGTCICKPGFHGKHCEIRCAEGTFGPECQGNCLCQNNSTCHHVTGKCTCLSGWSGENCQNPCQKGYFGIDCQGTCYERCYNFESCHPVTGECLCKDGWVEPDCAKPCSSGTYGPNCTYVCDCDSASFNLTDSEIDAIAQFEKESMSTTTILTTQSPSPIISQNVSVTITPVDLTTENINLFVDNFYEVYNQSVSQVSDSLKSLPSSLSLSTNDSTSPTASTTSERNKSNSRYNNNTVNKCDPVAGRCICPPGRNGPRCAERCPRNTYGIDCMNECACEHAAVTCHAVHGRCEACEEGWYGERCHIACAKGFFGTNCANKCNCVVGAETCHPVTGTCICPAGKTGKDCKEDCPPGWFGIFCQHRCTCPNNTANWCDAVSGFCSCPPGYSTRWRCNRCQVGLYGLDCQLKCQCGAALAATTGEMMEDGVVGTTNSFRTITAVGPCKRKTGDCLCPTTHAPGGWLDENTIITTSNTTTEATILAQQRNKECLDQLYRSYDFDTNIEEFTSKGEYRHRYGGIHSNDLIGDGVGDTFFLRGLTTSTNENDKNRRHQLPGSDTNKWSADINSVSLVFIICTGTLIVVILTTLIICFVVRRKKRALKRNLLERGFSNSVLVECNKPTGMGLPIRSRNQSDINFASCYHGNGMATIAPPSPPPIDFLVNAKLDRSRNQTALTEENIYSLGDDEGDIYEIDYEYPASVFGTIERKGFNSMSESPPNSTNQFTNENHQPIIRNKDFSFKPTVSSGVSSSNAQCFNAKPKGFLGLNASTLKAAAKSIVSKSNSPAKSSQISEREIQEHGGGVTLRPQMQQHHEMVPITGTTTTTNLSGTNSKLRKYDKDNNVKNNCLTDSAGYLELRQSSTSSTLSTTTYLSNNQKQPDDNKYNCSSFTPPDRLSDMSIQDRFFPSTKIGSGADSLTLREDSTDNYSSAYLVPTFPDTSHDLQQTPTVVARRNNSNNQIVRPSEHNYHKLDYTGKSFKPNSVNQKTVTMLRQYYEHNKFALASVAAADENGALISPSITPSKLSISPSTSSQSPPPVPTRNTSLAHFENTDTPNAQESSDGVINYPITPPKSSPSLNNSCKTRQTQTLRGNTKLSTTSLIPPDLPLKGGGRHKHISESAILLTLSPLGTDTKCCNDSSTSLVTFLPSSNPDEYDSFNSSQNIETANNQEDTFNQSSYDTPVVNSNMNDTTNPSYDTPVNINNRRCVSIK